MARSDVRAEDTTDAHWRHHMDVNVDGLFWCCRAFGGAMLKQGKGSIVNIGSMSGFIVNKPQPQSFYNASKAAVHHLTRSLAAEWGARGVRVNAVAPTYIETPLTAFGINEFAEMYKVWLEMTPMGRVGQPDEIASVVHFLASDAASLMTGSIVLDPYVRRATFPGRWPPSILDGEQKLLTLSLFLSHVTETRRLGLGSFAPPIN